jgi:integrase
MSDPIAYFLEDIELHGRAERTREGYERVLRQFEAFLANDAPGAPEDPGTATHRQCMAWIHSLRGELAEGTLAIYAANVHRFYDYMTAVGELDGNPMTLVLEEMDESIDTDPTRREVGLPVMREFVDGIQHPLERATLLTLLKTGMRVGELCNLDLRDIRLEEIPVAEYGLDGRPRLGDRRDSLFVSAAPERGREVNGERRTASNKRKRATVLPVDEELRQALVRWLAVRPDPVSSADPLFLRTSEGWGERLDPPAVRHIVERHARAFGWYRTGGGAAENVTPHYFRHFFTTHLRDRTGDRGIVKYLRGDVADDVIDTYTHNWGDRVRETYLESIYSLV